MESSALIIKKNNKILFLLRAKKPFGWGLPGGKFDEGETPEDCALRETFEETGLQFQSEQIKYVHKKKSVNGHDVYVFSTYLEKTPKVKVNVNPSEHIEFKWIKEKDFDKFKMAGNTLEFLGL